MEAVIMPENLIRWTRTGEGLNDVHLEFSRNGGTWTKYNLHPIYQPDIIPGASKGYRTAQLLLRAGYVYAVRG